MSGKKHMTALALMGVFLSIFFSVSVAHADDDDERETARHEHHEHEHHSDDDRGRHYFKVTNPKLTKECGACHVVYTPNLLPTASWRAIMSDLGNHFGADASLDAATQEELSDYLQKHAGSRDEVTTGKPVLRISDMRWFKREHHEISTRTWQSAKVKTDSNCGACHTKADEGNFSERYVHIPR